MCSVTMERLSQSAPASWAEAARAIHAGRIVILPIYHAYMVCGHLWQPAAVRAVEAATSSDADLCIISPTLGLLADVVNSLPDRLWPLLERSWPGPLQIVAELQQRVPRPTRSMWKSLPIWIPSGHYTLRTLETMRTSLIATPLCDAAGRIVTSVPEDGMVPADIILDGGDIGGRGLPTVLDVMTNPAHILRRGVVSIGEIASALGQAPRVR